MRPAMGGLMLVVLPAVFQGAGAICAAAGAGDMCSSATEAAACCAGCDPCYQASCTDDLCVWTPPGGGGGGGGGGDGGSEEEEGNWLHFVGIIGGLFIFGNFGCIWRYCKSDLRRRIQGGPLETVVVGGPSSRGGGGRRAKGEEEGEGEGEEGGDCEG